MNADSPQPSLSLVILCYRSGDFARTFTQRTIEALDAAGIESYELILVGNYIEGSQDPTPAVVEELAQEDPRVRCTARPKQGWMGWDMRSGLRAGPRRRHRSHRRGRANAGGRTSRCCTT